MARSYTRGLTLTSNEVGLKKDCGDGVAIPAVLVIK